MRELLYDDSALSVIKEKFPDVVVNENARDFVHPNRVEIEILDEKRDSFYVHAIMNGYSEVLFNFQLMLMSGEKKHIQKIKKWIATAKGKKEN